MDIGPDKKEIISEPLTSPVPAKEPEREVIPSERPPERRQQPTPDQEPSKV